MQRLRRAAGTRADLLKVPSFDAEIGCAQTRRDALTPLDVKFDAEAADGIVEISTTLATRGTTATQLERALSGQVSLRGRDLVFVGIDLDAAFGRLEAGQTFSLARGNGGRSEVRTRSRRGRSSTARPG